VDYLREFRDMNAHRDSETVGVLSHVSRIEVEFTARYRARREGSPSSIVRTRVEAYRIERDRRQDPRN